MKRTIEQQCAILSHVMIHVGLYTRQHPANLERCEMTQWHMSAAIYAMVQLHVTYLSIADALNLTFPQVSRHMAIARDQIDRCIFFSTAAKLYSNAGIEALQNLQTKQPA